MHESVVAETVKGRRARRLGGLTMATGGFVLLTAVGVLLAHTVLLESRGDHFGLSALGPIVFLIFIAPFVAVVGTIGFLYIRAGQRAHVGGEFTDGIHLAGTSSLVLAVAAVVLANNVSELLAGWHLLAVVVVLGAHATLVVTYARDTVARRREAGWLLAGAVAVTVGVFAVLADGADLSLFSSSGDDDTGTRVTASVIATPAAPRRPPVQGRRTLLLSPDGKLLVTAIERRISAHDLETDRARWSNYRGGHADDDPAILALSPDGSSLLFADEAITTLHSAADGRLLRELQCTPPNADEDARVTVSATFARGGEVAVLTSSSPAGGLLCAFDVKTGNPLFAVRCACHALSASTRGDRVWALCDAGITAFDPTTGAQLQVLAVPARRFAVFPDGTRLLVARDGPGGARLLDVHDVAGEEAVQTFTIADRVDGIVGARDDGATWILHGERDVFEYDLHTRTTVALCELDDILCLTTRLTSRDAAEPAPAGR